MSDEARKTFKIALAGNPNCGKTTIFNYLTGEKRAVGNYSGVTVEMVRGRFRRENVEFELVDLPGIYSLTTFSKDEVVAREFLLTEKPDVIVNVVDASNLERNLFLTLQLKELGIPTLVILNMVDLAKARGLSFDSKNLSERIELPIIEAVGSTGEGLDLFGISVLEAQKNAVVNENAADYSNYSGQIEEEISLIAAALDSKARQVENDPEAWNQPLGIQWLLTGGFTKEVGKEDDRRYAEACDEPAVTRRRRWLALKLIEDDEPVVKSWNYPDISKLASGCVERLSGSDGAPLAAKIAAERYANVRKICHNVVHNEKTAKVKLSDQADRILTHPFWGLLIFFAAMFLVFWLTFTLGDYPVKLLERGQELLGSWCNRFWLETPNSLLRSLIVDGIIAGVGSVLVFLPNIIILFAAISVLEECGYMARGAFLTDRFLTHFGLTGKSFIPMLVGFGCSVPAVMATRIIEDKKSRLATIFVIPLMSCGARFPIYMLLVPAFFPSQWQAPVLWGIYVLGIAVAAILSTIVTRFTFKGEVASLLIELPPYHKPTLKTAGAKALERGWQYIRKAGTTILGVSILFWAASTFPTLPQDKAALFEEQETAILQESEELGIDLDVFGGNSSSADEVADSRDQLGEQVDKLLERRRRNNADEAEARLEYSFAGRIGKAIEPIILHAGFDWRIGVGLVGAMTAKEVFVAQMGIVYKIGEADEDSVPLQTILRNHYSPLIGLCVIIFSLIAAPCLATVVVVARESSFRWAFAQWLTLTLIGFSAAVLIYRLGTFFHLGT